MNIENMDLDFNIDDNKVDDELIDATMSDEDILARLSDTPIIAEKILPIKRIQAPITIKSLSEIQLKNIRKQCTKIRKENGQNKEIFDNQQFKMTVLKYGIVKPQINDAILREKNLSSIESFWVRFLSPGEIEKIVEEITILSGFGTEFDEDLLKNE
ncbi:phage tail assembly chaperone [Peptostreptococcus sp. D1]|uniref:phage tail assembly chaperone n=1 Tax=Peptostreptococcus sp. D1 TaxID=72304 RepID=UPI0008E9FDA7|nr:hypothetical protein [Peptostreptococcus sp. D1]SFE92106.1 Phage XkdN-like tail assembly chaperone protein, TAC [Peptostreptococcus sp. D1]